MMLGQGFPRWCRPGPATGWLRRLPWLRQAMVLMRRAFAEFRADHCPQVAAAISYHVLFSVFPLAILIVGIVGLVTQDPHARGTVVTAVLTVVPLSGQGRQQLRGLIGSVGGGAGALGLLGLIGVIWSASGMMAAVRTALNVAWDTEARRPFIRGKIVDLALVGGVFLVTGATVGLTVAASIIRRSAASLPHALRGLEPLAGTAAWLAVVAASVALLFAIFAFLYRVVPAVPTRMRGIWPGALAAAVGFEAGQNLRPPKARTWAPRGRTPVVRVPGKGSGRVSVAGLVYLKPGARGRLYYRVRIHRGRKGERRSMSEADYAGLITAAHQELKAPVILIWDRLDQKCMTRHLSHARTGLSKFRITI